MARFTYFIKNAKSNDKQMVEQIGKINFEAKNNQPKINKSESLVDPIKPKTKKKWLKILIIVIGFLLVFSGICFLMTKPVIAKAKQALTLGQEAYNSVKEQDLIQTDEKLKATKTKLEETKKAYRILSWLKIIPFFNNYYKDGERGLNAAIKGIEAGEILTGAIAPYADVLGFKGKGSFSGGSTEERLVKIVETLDKIMPQIDESIKKLDEAQQEIQLINPNRYPKQIAKKPVREKIEQTKSKFSNLAVSLKETEPILEVLPALLGHPDSRKYLVIFENDGELRPTGGFITAYSILTMESGKIRADNSNDIYSLDKKNPYKVKTPPEAIQKYLLSADLKTGIVPYWYLRDMNFSPDFFESMKVFEENYQKIPGEPEIDGIIALDTKILKDLVMLLGDLEVPGFGKFTMNEDKRCHNIPQIVCELEYIVDTPIGGEKVDRKGVLGPMMQALMQKAMTAPKALWPRLLKIALQDIKEKHALLYFNREDEQKAAEAFKAAGRIVDYDGDYLHINDSNFGGAKSNLFVEHTVEQEINIDNNGTVEKTLTLTYVNPEPMDNCNLERKSGLCLNGVLRNFIRVYVPKGSKLIEMMGSEVEAKSYDELDKTVFEGFFTLRGDGGKAKLVVKYTLPFEIKDNKTYNLLIQKQPGTLGHKYIINLDNQQEEFKLDTDKEFRLKI